MATAPDARQDDRAAPRFPSPLYDLMYGHIHASVLRAVVLHGIPDLLADGPLTAGELAARSGTRVEPLRRVLRLLAARGLFREFPASHTSPASPESRVSHASPVSHESDDEQRGESVFGLTESGAALRSDVPGSQRAPVLMFTDEMFHRSAAALPGTLRSGEPGFDAAFGVPFFDYLADAPDKSGLFDAAMTSRPGTSNADIAESCPFPASGTVVDVGGGRGGLLREVLVRFPGLTGVLFDRPGTVAGHLLDDEALTGRWRAEDGDFFTAVPRGGDVYLLKNVLHDWPDEDCVRILGVLRAAVEPGTRLFVVDAVLPGDGSAHPAFAVDIIMLMLVRGRERTAGEFRDLLARSGFRLDHVVPTPSLSSVVVAEAV
ncbi:methyltransferase [Streptomyces cacaoi]|uniref:methyltransferase n=1 Tax=Streptomyces cacaoi TaxID=1898 RepID=UPI00374A20C4